MVIQRGIEANPLKIRNILDMKASTNVNECFDKAFLEPGKPNAKNGNEVVGVMGEDDKGLVFFEEGQKEADFVSEMMGAPLDKSPKKEVLHVDKSTKHKEAEQVSFFRIIRVLAHIQDNSPSLLDSCSFCIEALSCLFCEDENIEAISHLLRRCEAASGPKMNLAKSSMVLSSNIPATDYGLLGVALGVDVVPKNDKYLGLPAVGGRSKKEMFDGILIKVWNHIQGRNISNTWISSLRDSTLDHLSDRGASSVDLVMSSLMDPHCNAWKINIVSEFFPPLDAEIILAIPLRRSNNEDRLFWHLNSRGNFTVRSAHHLALEIAEVNRSSHSGPTRNKVVMENKGQPAGEVVALADCFLHEFVEIRACLAPSQGVQ
ncbi:UNVERIFIED_CONTAM: hypothetical protein Scaly_0687900 [Sesamum calycinum]|uniref:Uncharacterized protein n=1 Tax=Sesamum calycinum TaxID=2727403 RepID=A0AAW2R6Q8_9LAMI